ncbi:hypothetical protein MNBD_GAMMA06-1461 [hydrothermal vent metagenome]|uniref:DUF3187 family protein n=1 Tax=hydrothermal vent metagenome TaxID=652676 RepID=A0A3B0WCV9_9ZZZZ
MRLCILATLFPTTLIATTEQNKQTKFQPFATRDQNIFNLIHGQPLPTNAALNKKSQGLWSNSLAITNTLNIESNADENIYLDYEAYRFNFSYQHGLNDQWNLKIDVPVIYQSGGVFDSSIDNWHKLWGLPKGLRPHVENNQYEAQYTYQSQTLVNLNEASSTVGDIQLAVARSLIENKHTTMSLWTSLKLPTGSEDKLTSNGATDFSTWLALNQQLSDNWVININTGAVVLGANNYKNIPLADYSLYGHVMLGWLVTNNINLKLQLQGHTSYYDESQLNILGDTYLLTFGGSISINQCNQLDIAMSEDIKVEASPDISLIINWRSYTSGC